MNIQIKKKKGRPTKQEQKELEEKLQQYYEKNYSPIFTSRKTGNDKKTVYKYFNKWDTELLESNNDFLKRCKVAREKGIITLEEEIESLNDQESEVDWILQLLKKSGDFQKIERYSKLKLKIKENKMKFMRDKINLIGTPTYDTIQELNSRAMCN